MYPIDQDYGAEIKDRLKLLLLRDVTGDGSSAINICINKELVHVTIQPLNGLNSLL